MTIKIDNMEIHLLPRAAEILRHLLKAQARLSEITCGRWTVDFLGRSVESQIIDHSRKEKSKISENITV